jgi:hypothetical protein
MKAEMEVVFEQKVKEKIMRLKESELNVSRLGIMIYRLKRPGFIRIFSR